ncbi:histamine H2 receptor-like isoform X1 [Actinia tenebrosa]|uniref:Histamine H2 receptor-like isoform X1 n=1 Tax=Actinia tenebrosa TaxID=6105 RepID=A0A6P8HZZ9_ACTTE|nr:histamine H2 receptor-like isoform X1 [Actinia tenebrosa]XP_031561019.1 histamine H2 receptor-like isoform X1 [Actinia tenebrosa]XP_031561021.1 histamine H2 receptor-like isoform X1 [Actinia tenebrosa]XP_031561022.1 histamine H2 receptor-like isoform X1 [Actinia tenebrosa]XP_031561023.1 histamine H2 receptor-like isoform X1 [Actinia tenebrosa]
MSFPGGYNSTTPFDKMNDSVALTLRASQGEVVVSLIFNIALMATVIAGNGLILSAFAINSRMRTVHSILIIGLSSADLLVGAISIPCWIYVMYHQHNNYPINFYGYQFYITADIFIGASSIFHLTGISIERCHAVMKPIIHRLLSRRIFYSASAVAWFFAAIIAILQPVQFQNWEKVYTLLNANLIFFLPTGIIIIAYICVFQRSKFGPGVSLTRHRASRAVFAREVRLSLTLGLITVLFVLAWLPLFTLTMIATFNHKLLPDSVMITQRLLGFVKWMHYCSSALNPFLYSYRNNDMRGTIKLIIQKHFFRQNICLEELYPRHRRRSTFSSRSSFSVHKRLVTSSFRPASVSSQYSVCSFRSRNKSEDDDNNNKGKGNNARHNGQVKDDQSAALTSSGQS